MGPPVTTKPNQLGNKINCYLKIVRGKVALNGTNAKYSAFLSDQITDQMEGCDSRKNKFTSANDEYGAKIEYYLNY